MSITVAILSQGTMGSGVGKRLHENGAAVRTLHLAQVLAPAPDV